MEYQTKYTENHPDVLVLKKKIEALEKEPADGSKTRPFQTAKAGAGSERQPADHGSGAARAAAGRFCATSRPSRPRSSRFKAQIDYYQKRVENTPKREQGAAPAQARLRQHQEHLQLGAEPAS